MAKHRDILQLNKIHCNNIHTMAEHYGIEAGARVIVKVCMSFQRESRYMHHYSINY